MSPRAPDSPHLFDRYLTIVLLATFALSACGRDSAPADSAVAVADAGEEFWRALHSLCGKSFSGTLAEGGPQDSALANAALVMQVRECSDEVIRIPFHVGDDRSRTWVLSRTAAGFRLKHDHRHEDGREDSITQYGGDTRNSGTAHRQEFHADSLTAALIPAARANVWTVEVVRDSLFAYALRREGTDRRVRVEFDLRRPVDAPPPPWGAR